MSVAAMNVEGLGTGPIVAPNPFVEEFGSVLGLSVVQTAELIERMANENHNPESNYFVYIAQQLPVLDLNLSVNVVPITSGSFGKISKITKAERANRVLKEQRVHFGFPHNIEYTPTSKKQLEGINDDLRDIFIEIFIQFILGQDMQYGHNVVKLYNVYRSADAKAIYIEMDYIDSDIFSYCKSLCQTYGYIDNANIVYILLFVANILKVFNDRFGFVHRDLKVDNVGIKDYNGKRNIVLFDFGSSCIKYLGRQYSTKAFFDTLYEPCNINSDLALFTYSLYLQFHDCLEHNMIGFFKDLLNYKDLLKELNIVIEKRGIGKKIHSIYNYNGTLFRDKYYQFCPINYIGYVNEFISKNHLDPIDFGTLHASLVPEENTRSLTYSVASNSEGGRRRRRQTVRRTRRTVRRN